MSLECDKKVKKMPHNKFMLKNCVIYSCSQC